MMAIAKEFEQTGRVADSLPEDDKLVRELHAKEVLEVDVETLDALEPRTPGTQFGTGADPRVRSNRPVHQLGDEKKPEKRRKKSRPGRKRKPKSQSPEPVSDVAADDVPTDDVASTGFHLEVSDPIVDAPSIGPKTARRLRKAQIQTVADLLDCDPEAVQDQLRVRHITAEKIEDWQHQSRLMCQIPGIRGHDAQILVACGVQNPRTLQAASTDDLLELAVDFAESEDGVRLLRGGSAPDRAEVEQWIEWAGESRSLRAA